MRIALIGFGKMGREIDSLAREQGETITCVFDSHHPVQAKELAEVDVCIDFSTPTSVLSNIHAAIAAGKDIVVGTTGWQEHLEDIRAKAVKSGVLHSPNFSLGMNIFMRLAARAAELMQNAEQYDPFIHEMHHRSKIDAPSGTALRLADSILQKMERIEPGTLPIASTRAGFITGSHTVGFDSESDLIELRHVAKNRRGFAFGSLTAARWLRGRKGIYTMDDVEL